MLNTTLRCSSRSSIAAATIASTKIFPHEDAEPLLALPPVPFPAVIEVTRVVADNATVAYRGNR